jgi:hypothetical protein
MASGILRIHEPDKKVYVPLRPVSMVFPESFIDIKYVDVTLY